MRIQLVLESIEKLTDLQSAIVWALLAIVLLAVLLAVFRLPFVYCIILLVGMASTVRFGAFGAIGLLGRYLMVALLAMVALVDRRPFRMSAASWAYLAWVGVIVLQSPRSPSMADALVRIAYYLCSFFGFIILTQKVCRNPDQFRKAVWWMMVVSFVTVWVQLPLMGYGEDGRPQGVFLSVANLGNAMMMAIVIITYAMMAGYIKRFLLLAGVATLIAAAGLLVISAGRTAILAAVLSMPFLFRMRPGRALLIALPASVLGVFVLSRLLPQIDAYQGALGHMLSTDSSGRFGMWSAIWSDILESPVIGHGLDQNLVYGYGSVGNEVHSLYFQIAYDFGVPVALAMLVLLLLGLVNAWRQVARLPVGPSRQMAALGGALLMMVVAPSFLGAGLLSLDLTWSLFCISLGIQSAVSQSFAEHENVEGEYAVYDYGQTLAYGVAPDYRDAGRAR